MINALKIIVRSSDSTKIAGDNTEFWLHNFAGDPIYFYNDEVMEVELISYRQLNIQTNLQNKSFIYEALKVDSIPAAVGADGILSASMMINLNILHAHSDTATRIQSVIDGRLAKIYYKYIEDATAFKVFVIDPSFFSHYKYGYKAARVITQMAGYETANYVRKVVDDY